MECRSNGNIHHAIDHYSRYVAVCQRIHALVSFNFSSRENYSVLAYARYGITVSSEESHLITRQRLTRQQSGKVGPIPCSIPWKPYRRTNLIVCVSRTDDPDSDIRVSLFRKGKRVEGRHCRQCDDRIEFIDVDAESGVHNATEEAADVSLNLIGS